MSAERYELNKQLAQMLKGNTGTGKDCRGGGSMCSDGAGKDSG